MYYMSKKVLFLAITTCIFSSFIFSACKTVDWAAVEKSNDVDLLWRFIQESPDDIRAAEARARIASIEFREAQKLNTRYAYRVFLERHPQSTFAVEARQNLERLDFEDAERANTREAWEAFLRAYPRSGRSEAATKSLYGILCASAKTASPEELDAILREHPNIPCATVLEAQSRDKRFEQAMSRSDTKAILDLLERYPDHPAAPEARKQIIEKQVEQLVLYAKYDIAIGLVLSHAKDTEADRLVESIRREKLQWILESFDLGLIKKYLYESGIDEALVAGFVGALEKNALAVKTLREAAEVLRSPAVDLSGLDLQADPKNRWEYAELLSLLPDEKSADELLALLSDQYLEVRRRAFLSLAAVIEKMGPIRKMAWLASSRAKLIDTARQGDLLFRLYSIETLAGDTVRAEQCLERLFDGREDPDPLVAHQSVLLKLSLGRGREAAVAAAAFCAQARAWFEKRTADWSMKDGLGSSGAAWLSLRQLFGLGVLWREVLEPFERGGSSFSEDLGPWLEKGRADLAALEAWLSEQEERWERSHPGYVRSGAEPSLAREQKRRQEEEQLAALRLALAGPEPSLTLRWAACCHPRLETRASAALASYFFRVRRGLPAVGSP